MVVGHTVQDDGLINQRCNGQLLLIDVGISEVYGRHAAALEIIASQVTAIYPWGRVLLAT